MLQNLTHRFVRPNVIDIKIGTQLWDNDSSPEKVERMKQAAKATTSLETGVRWTGFQVSTCDNPRLWIILTLETRYGTMLQKHTS